MERIIIVRKISPYFSTIIIKISPWIEIKIPSNSSKKSKIHIARAIFPLQISGIDSPMKLYPFVERDPVQNHCVQFTAANRTPRRRSTGWFPDSRDFIPRVKAHYSRNPIFIRDTAVCRNHGKSLSRRTYRDKRFVCVSGREATGNQGVRSNYRKIMDG